MLGSNDIKLILYYYSQSETINDFTEFCEPQAPW